MLSDPEQRKEYDQMRALGAGGARFSPGAGGDFEDLLGGMFGGAGGARGGFGGAGYEDILSGLFGGGARTQRGPQRGRDVHASTTLDFLTAANGETIRLEGTGGKPVNVKIPAGVADGQKIKLRGKGQPSPNGGERATSCSRSACGRTPSSRGTASTSASRCR